MCEPGGLVPSGDVGACRRVKCDVDLGHFAPDPRQPSGILEFCQLRLHSWYSEIHLLRALRGKNGQQSDPYPWPRVCVGRKTENSSSRPLIAVLVAECVLNL